MVTTLIRINSQSSMFFYYERMNQRLAVLRLELGGVLAIPQIQSNIKLQSTSNKSGGPQEGGRMEKDIFLKMALQKMLMKPPKMSENRPSKGIDHLEDYQILFPLLD